MMGLIFVVEPPHIMNIDATMTNLKESPQKLKANMNHDKSNGDVGSSSVANEIDVGYVSEDLGSSDHDASDDDKGPQYDGIIRQKLQL